MHHLTTTKTAVLPAIAYSNLARDQGNDSMLAGVRESMIAATQLPGLSTRIGVGITHAIHAFSITQ